MESISAEALSSDPAVALPASRALFTDLVEPLADRFDPADVETYVKLFSGILQQAFPVLRAEELEARFRRIREVRPVSIEPEKVYVPSRVTLGADVAVTSIVLDAAKRRFPRARIFLAGPRKNAELFAADPRIEPVEIPYPRIGALRDRLSIWPLLRDLFDSPGSLILDPDSRLTQLGLLPAGADERYHLFDSRSYGGNSADSLVHLTQSWLASTLGVPDARAYLATGLPAEPYATTVSFGVGENPAKRIPDPFEAEILKLLPRPILIDRGAGGEEAQRVERAVTQSGIPVQFWDGSFAGFAAHIARSRLYIGYDSAGGHVAAASAVPLLSIFTGFISPRMFQRWRPSGPGPTRVLEVETPDPPEVLHRCRAALAELIRE